jgi:hypothetical protein
MNARIREIKRGGYESNILEIFREYKNWYESIGGGIGKKSTLNELLQLKKDGVKNISVNGFTEDIDYLIETLKNI